MIYRSPIGIDASVAASLREAYFREKPGSIGPFAARLGVPEVHVLAALKGDESTEIDLSHFDALMEALKGLNPVRFIVRTDGCVLESVGELGGYSRGKFFNIQNNPLHVHISPERLGSAFAVRKKDLSEKTSLALHVFNFEGGCAFRISPERIRIEGKLRGPYRPEQETGFQEILSTFALSSEQGARE